jgi:hypothetical protein
LKSVLSSAAVAALLIATTVPGEAARRKPGVRNAETAGSGGVTTPEIRTTAENRVPQCVTPQGLMKVVAERNPALEERFKTIATFYKQHGETLKIRWDYAFYQMVLETNYLMYKRGDGRPGDVKPRQNNFAGIGATGNGVPGESYPDVSTGVLAQLQHLVAYSGERVANPVAPRTRENQDNIIRQSQRLGRAVKFGDLTNRWAHDRNYATSINVVAERFQASMCNGQTTPVAAAPQPAAKEDVIEERRKGRDLARKAIEDGRAEGGRRAALGATKLANPAPPPSGCTVMAASFGGSVTLLIRAASNAGVTYTALDVEGGREEAMADAYMKAHAEGGRILGRFKTRDEAVAHAYDLCDSGKP